MIVHCSIYWVVGYTVRIINISSFPPSVFPVAWKRTDTDRQTQTDCGCGKIGYQAITDRWPSTSVYGNAVIVAQRRRSNDTICVRTLPFITTQQCNATQRLHENKRKIFIEKQTIRHVGRSWRRYISVAILWPGCVFHDTDADA